MKRIKQIFYNVIPYIWMMGGFLLNLYYEIGPGKLNLDGDAAAEMLLAKQLQEEGSILSTNWIYSTQYQVLNVHWLFRIGLRLFPNDYHMARVVGAVLAFLLLID